MGGSIAGLLAARQLADHFGEVVVLEKDTFPPVGENRRSVPQGRHIHVLLERGRQTMERALPGLTDELVGLGAAVIEDASRDVRWYYRGFHAPGISGIRPLGVARPTLEGAIRARVLALPRIEAREDCRVTGLVTDDADGRVTGVHCTRPADGGADDIVSADLVVDATGRGSRSPRWLDALGYAPPGQEEVEIGLGYTTCFYRRRPEHLDGFQGLIFLVTPTSRSMGVIVPQSRDRWAVTLGGYFGHHAPTAYDDYVEFARGLPTPHIHDVIRSAERLTEPAVYKFPASRRRHYEKLSRFPDGYLVLGDALCSFNPIYGQGMTVAAMEAEALGRCLADGRASLARRFFGRAARIIDIPWNTAVSTDLGFPQVEGRRTPLVRFLNWYLPRLHAAACADAEVSTAFLRVVNMVSPPTSILRPRIVWRVLRGARRGRQRPRGRGADAAGAERAAGVERAP